MKDYTITVNITGTKRQLMKLTDFLEEFLEVTECGFYDVEETDCAAEHYDTHTQNK